VFFAAGFSSVKCSGTISIEMLHPLTLFSRLALSAATGKSFHFQFKTAKKIYQGGEALASPPFSVISRT
jgi:hypothetical protein